MADELHMHVLRCLLTSERLCLPPRLVPDAHLLHNFLDGEVVGHARVFVTGEVMLRLEGMFLLQNQWSCDRVIVSTAVIHLSRRGRANQFILLSDDLCVTKKEEAMECNYKFASSKKQCQKLQSSLSICKSCLLKQPPPTAPAKKQPLYFPTLISRLNEIRSHACGYIFISCFRIPTMKSITYRQDSKYQSKPIGLGQPARQLDRTTDNKFQAEYNLPIFETIRKRQIYKDPARRQTLYFNSPFSLMQKQTERRGGKTNAHFLPRLQRREICANNLIQTDIGRFHATSPYVFMGNCKNQMSLPEQSSNLNIEVLFTFIISLKYHCVLPNRQMGLIKRIKQAVQVTDFFNSTQMLRYQNQNQYRTFTGGVISLGIIVTIAIGFASMILDTLTLSTITYTQDVITSPDPTYTKLVASPNEKFMFGIEIWRQNLSSPVRYFDLVPQVYVEEAGVNTPITIDLVQCTKEHWSSMPDVVKNFDKLQMSGWLCPPIGAEYEIFGKYTSDFYKQIIFTVSPCNNATDPNRPCASQAEIDQLFLDHGDWFYFTFYYINTIVNPDQPTYKSYYLEDTAYVIFGKQMGVESYLYFADFDIQTDYSIWPFESIQSDLGFLTQSKPTSHPYPITVDNQASYVTFCVAKSPNSIAYSRQVQKISNVFSFMGGLIGALMAGLFIVHAYTSFAYEISIAIQIFKKDRTIESDPSEKDPDQEKHGNMVNFVQFVQYYLYKLKKLICRDYTDENSEFIVECRKQILRQLDIKSLIKRLIFLEYSMTFIFSDYQLEGLQLHKPTHPLDVKAVRKRIENIDLAELESAASEEGKNKELNDNIQPQSSFNLGSFLNSPKVANLNSLSTHPTQPTGVDHAISGQMNQFSKQIVLESVSEVSLQEEEKKRRYVFQKKKTTRLQNLMESANDGNEISKRIWRSIKRIQQLKPPSAK